MSKLRTEISFSGLNLNRTIDKLSQKYVLYNVSRSGKQCKITVEQGVYMQVVAFLREKCYNITDIRQVGLGGLKYFFKTHFLLPVYIVVALVILFVSANFCWKIDISGDYDTQTVLDALKSFNVKVGAGLFNLDKDKLENSLSNKLDAMYAVVNRKGSALYVNVVKRKTIDPPLDMNKRRDIVASCDGTVLSVLCEQGTAAVKVGDKVKSGDLLIAGLRTFNDGTTQDVYALGCITLQPVATGFAPFTGVAMQEVETGKTFTTNVVVLFGREYGKNPPFVKYRMQSKQVALYPLNLVVKRVTYFEISQVETAVTLDQCLDQLKLQALQLAEQQANFQIKSTQYQVSDNGVTAIVFGEIEIT